MNRTQHGSSGLERNADVTCTDLEREQLISYLEWGETKIPGWWLVAYALAITLWFASHDLQRWMTITVTIAFVVAMAALTHYMTARTGVSMPRFRSMPSSLRRAYLPPIIASCVLMALAILLVASDSLPVSASVVGLAVGPMMALAAVWSTRRYRSAADRLARDAGIRQ